MARSDPQVNIRMPLELKERIEEVAKSNNRSMNAEIISALQEIYRQNVAPTTTLPAGTPDEAFDALFAEYEMTQKKALKELMKKHGLTMNDVRESIIRKSNSEEKKK